MESSLFGNMLEIDPPSKVAFCLVYFGANGGKFNSLGQPILEPNIPGRCDHAFDCNECVFLSTWIEQLTSQNFIIGWECNKCLSIKEKNRFLPGYYQSGWKDEDTVMKGCTKCGWESSFLQLVLRRI